MKLLLGKVVNVVERVVDVVVRVVVNSGKYFGLNLLLII
jgi:hypothetical protein